jgi:hypothetical protein
MPVAFCGVAGLIAAACGRQRWYLLRPPMAESLCDAHPTGLRPHTIDGLVRSRTATMPSVVELCLSQGGPRVSRDIG